MSQAIDYIIIGSGPTGLGAAIRLKEINRLLTCQSFYVSLLSETQISGFQQDKTPKGLLTCTESQFFRAVEQTLSDNFSDISEEAAQSAYEKYELYSAKFSEFFHTLKNIPRRAITFLVVDAGNCPGGLASTRVTPEKFLFDMGGHVIFSHYTYFDQVINESVDRFYTHERVSYVNCCGQWAPYPIQFNLKDLPKQECANCISSLIDIHTRDIFAEQKNIKLNQRNKIWKRYKDLANEGIIKTGNCIASVGADIEQYWYNSQLEKQSIDKIQNCHEITETFSDWSQLSLSTFDLKSNQDEQSPISLEMKCDSYQDSKRISIGDQSMCTKKSKLIKQDQTNKTELKNKVEASSILKYELDYVSSSEFEIVESDKSDDLIFDEYELISDDELELEARVAELKGWKLNEQLKYVSTFTAWSKRNMGDGLYRIFMKPYNRKVWGVPLHLMGHHWLGERVAKPDLKRCITNCILEKEDKSWGPNATFRFPANLGTAGIWCNVARQIGTEYFRWNSMVKYINVEKKYIQFTDSTKLYYNEKLFSTAPLDDLLSLIKPSPILYIEPRGLLHNYSYIIGLGLRGFAPDDKKCWLYFADPNVPFYRATIFSKYSPRNVPPAKTVLPTIATCCEVAEGKVELTADDIYPFVQSWTSDGEVIDRVDQYDCDDEEYIKLEDPKSKCTGPYWSLMFEITESDFFPLKPGSGVTSIFKSILESCISTELTTPDCEIVSTFFTRIPKGYPIPSVTRDTTLENILPILESKNIISRGRFGAWKYEVANQDHSFMQGVELVDKEIFGIEEKTLFNPNFVNTRKNISNYFLSTEK